MCLYTKQICPLRAKKDIVCYKYVLKADSYHSEYVTPIMSMPIDIGDTYRAMGKEKRTEVKEPLLFGLKAQPNELSSITEGYIHCYAIKVKPTTIGHIIECIIPKGTLYYKSYDGKQIAAKEIRTIKLIK